MGTVNRETLLTLDEAVAAREIARGRFDAMLADLDYSAPDPGTSCADAEREKTLAVVAWRQAVTLVLTGRCILQTGVSG